MGRRLIPPATGCAWVTGASSGLGAATALELARQGWTVAISARRAEQLAEVAGRVEPGRLVPIPLDVTDLDAVHAAVTRIEAEIAPIELALLNAGGYKGDSATAPKLADFKATVELNLFGTMGCLEAIVPRMVARRSGQIALVASVAGYRGLPRALTYGATKAALIHMAETMHLQLSHRHGVKVQVVNPGFVRTPATDQNDFPMPFLMEADDAARALVAGLAGRSFEITFPWQFVSLMKLARRLPYWAYFPLVRQVTRQ